VTSLGAFGESWAVGALTRLGYTVIERNVRFREGEIDIIAQDGECLVFVEVKTRRTGMFGSPEESITRRRYQHLAAAIQRYLQTRNADPADYRVDLLTIEVDSRGRVHQSRITRRLAAPGA
jgi:putative endonuclease